MKPVLMFGATFAFLLGGTFAGRFLCGNRSATVNSQTVAACFSASLTAPETALAFSSPKAIPLGAFDSATGEAAALRGLANVLTPHPDQPVTVEWTETYKTHRTVRRARYVPAALTLTCECQGGFYAYSPVTPDGMRESLERETEAPFANAHLYSLPQAAFRW